MAMHEYHGPFNSRSQRLRSKLGARGIPLDRLDALLHGHECRICGAAVPQARVALIEVRSRARGPEAPVLCAGCARQDWQAA